MNVSLTGIERTFARDDIIVSKTDLKGKILYANDVFIDIADYTEAELIGAPHKILRHPDMPRTVFKVLWDAIQSKNEVFAYVVNRTKFGDHYWVLAHVTPSLDDDGNLVAYHSTRRVPNPKALEVIKSLYQQMREAEANAGGSKQALEAGGKVLQSVLEEKGMSYSQLIFALESL